MTHIQKNLFRTRIPFFFTTDITEQPFLQKNRVVCSPDGYRPPIQPLDVCPEFIMAFPWTDDISIVSCVIWDVMNNVEVQDITTLVQSTSYTGQVLLPEGEFCFIAFPEFMAQEGFFDELTCGIYQYRLEVGGAYPLHYSDYFEVKSFRMATGQITEDYLTLYVKNTCSFHGIPWNQMIGSSEFRLCAHFEAPMVRITNEIEEEVVTAGNGRQTVVSSSITHRHQGNIVDCGVPLYQQLSMMQLYKPGESGSAVTHNLLRQSTYDDLGDFTVKQLFIGQPNYSASKCCPVVPIEIVVREKGIGNGCCDDSITPCLSEFTPPAPDLTLAGGNDITVAWTRSTSYPIPDDSVPQNCWIDIYYRVQGVGSWSVAQDIPASTDSLEILNFATGQTYEFYLKCQNQNGPECNSQNGTIATIAVP